ncbi:MAG: cytochrome c oxidase assembly protein subunit 15, partial [Candidatus Azotimanducaceae bacterium]
MPQSNKAITYWLVTLCVTIFTMIVVGGITRLTESGLSMVEWRPLLGAFPPTSDAEWQRVFAAYQN